jgi:predicted small metal-binding protein
MFPSPGTVRSMRVIECNECGDTVTAADDDELVRRLAAHLRQEHDEEPDEEELQDLVVDQAYDAMDS